MSVVAVIPARLASTRLAGKLLLAESGKPVLQHTWERASQVKTFSRVIVATDSELIARSAQAFGAEVELTGDHPSGTDRIAEVVRRAVPDAEVIVNVQGDEPEVEPDHLSELARLLIDHPAADMATLVTPLRSAAAVTDPARVKVVCASDGRALYFSRAPIPHVRGKSIENLFAESPDDLPWKLHLGLYAYRRDFLLRLTELPVSPLERLEKLEQLRALECGASIQTAEIEHPAVGIDTPDDYARFLERVRAA